MLSYFTYIRYVYVRTCASLAGLMCLARLTCFRAIHCTKMKFSIKDFFSKCDQICSFLWIWSHLLKNSLMENFIFCAVYVPVFLCCSRSLTNFLLQCVTYLSYLEILYLLHFLHLERKTVHNLVRTMKFNVR